MDVLECVRSPEISIWRNVSEKIGVNFNVGYVVSRPYITLEATAFGTAAVCALMRSPSQWASYSVF
jgi:hypothetical protein